MMAAVKVRFAAAFPWFDHARWARGHTRAMPWAHRPIASLAQRLALAARIEIWTSGADAERFQAWQRCLIRELRPAFEVPATRLVDVAAIGCRSGAHNSTLTPESTGESD